MVAVCKTWSIPGDKRITGLCSMEMFRETERIMKDGCPICVTPANANYNNTCQCPNGLVDGPRLYNLQVDEINGSWNGDSRPYGDTYGSFTLTNRASNGTYSCGASAPIVVQQPNQLTFTRGAWVLNAGGISVISGRLYRSHILSQVMYNGNTVIKTYSWVVPVYFPACDNRDLLPVTVPFHVNSVDEDTPGVNPFFPDVQANHYAITLSGA